MRACVQPTVNDCPYLSWKELGDRRLKRCSLPENLICSLTFLRTSQEPTAGSAETEEKKAANS